MPQITNKQAEQFNRMLKSLKTISKAYQTPKSLRKDSKSDYGLSYEEALEMAYENIKSEAAYSCRNVKPITLGGNDSMNKK